jgi:DNA topoisomerase IB
VKALNFMLSVVKSIKPRDQIESMLATQMAGIHTATMWTRLDSTERALNKLARTFAGHVEALKRYRTGGEQSVTVQHVSVSDGGQAIVGNVTQASRETAAEQVAKTAPQLTRAKQAPMTVLGAEANEATAVAVPRRDVKSDGKSSA